MTLDIAHYPTLALADTPEELRQLPQERLGKLCDELRHYLLRSVSRSSVASCSSSASVSTSNESRISR